MRSILAEDLNRVSKQSVHAEYPNRVSMTVSMTVEYPCGSWEQCKRLLRNDLRRHN